MLEQTQGMNRLFIALEPPEEFRESLTKGRPSAAARATPRDMLHLTLRFLGNVPQKDTARLSAAFEKLKIFPVPLIPEGFGFFAGSMHLRLRSTPKLLELKEAVDALVKKELGVESEDKPFKPHITILRMKFRLSDEDSRKISAWESGIQFPDCSAGTLTLFHSHFDGRLLHTPLASVTAEPKRN